MKLRLATNGRHPPASPVSERPLQPQSTPSGCSLVKNAKPEATEPSRSQIPDGQKLGVIINIYYGFKPPSFGGMC